LRSRPSAQGCVRHRLAINISAVQLSAFAEGLLLAERAGITATPAA
jgi:hypothetical protein